jgi:hypothetical protein
MRQERLGNDSSELRHALKLSCEHYIDFGGQSDGPALRQRLGRVLRQRDLHEKCKREKVSVPMATTFCKDYLDHGSQSSLESGHKDHHDHISHRLTV